MLIAIDPAAFGGEQAFAGRIELLSGEIDADGARLPGTRRLALRDAAMRDGIFVEDATFAQFQQIAASGAG